MEQIGLPILHQINFGGRLSSATQKLMELVLHFQFVTQYKTLL